MPPEKKKPARVRSVLRAYTKAALRYPWSLSGAIFGAIVGEAAGVVAPLYLRQFINLLSSSSPAAVVAQSLFVVLLFFTAVNLVGWAGQRLRIWTVNRLESRTMVDLYRNAFDYLLGHSHEFFISNFTGT